MVLRTVLFLCVVSLGSWASAQERPTTPLRADEIQQELKWLRTQLDSLKQARDTAIGDDDALLLEDRFDARLRELESKIDAIARSTAPTIFNPRTTAFLNFASRADKKEVLDEEGGVVIGNRPFLRSIELDLRGAVDPYAEAVIILAVEDEAGTGFALDPEEAYGLIKRLPIFESAPLGLKTKVGKFRAPFGTNNRLHMHDLPWTTRPLVVSKYLGTEHGDFFESGFNPIGVDFDFFLPSLIPGTTLEMSVGVIKSGDLRVAAGGFGYSATERRQPALLGHLTLSSEWNNEHLCVLGVSGYHEREMTYSNGRVLDERTSANTNLYGVDLTYKWTPARRGASRSFVIGGELITGEESSRDLFDRRIVRNPLGWFAYAQYQFSYGTYLGVRYDRVKEPEDLTQVTQAISAYLSYYTTEFLRLRLGWDKRFSTISQIDGITTLMFEANFVFGSHPTEPYWVTR